MPPGSAMPSSRAAMLTPSPRMSSPSTRTSPRWTPMSLGLPTCGYGIRYDHGLFRQISKDGWQQEYPEEWLSFRNPWEFERPEVAYDVHYGGRVEPVQSRAGAIRHVWHPAE